MNKRFLKVAVLLALVLGVNLIQLLLMGFFRKEEA